ncbi:MAG TPA: SH3 domain-containing protein [Firmicutes bacterium]|nr:SH3 domain-containing protein [Bacillota bacterium]
MAPQTFGETAETLRNEEERLLRLYHELVDLAPSAGDRELAKRLKDLEEEQLVILGMILGHKPPTPTPTPTQPSPPGEFVCTARVIVDFLNVREGPGTDRPVLRVLSRGTTVVILSQAGDWARVRLHDGTHGFVWRSFVECVTPQG